MKTILTIWFGMFFALHIAPGQIVSKATLEAARRQDPTGSGTFHRAGMLREQENALAAQKAAQSQVAKPKSLSEAPKKNKFFLARWISRIFGRSHD